MFDHCLARIALSWNDNISSAYRIAFAGEHDPGKKLIAILHPKNAIHFVSKLFIFQKVESDTTEKFGAADN